ncbi:ABC-type transport auxiliary lipoprotein family protein [Magnetospira thiophila]
MRRLTAWWAVLGLTVLFTACAQPDVPRDHFYRLDPGQPVALSAPLLDGTLEVERFTAVGLAAQRPIVYSDSNDASQAHAYHYHFWEESPGAMLQDRMVDFLRAAQLAKLVVTPELRADADFVITGRIQRLEQVLGSTTKGVLQIELILRRANNDELLHHGIYSQEISASGESVPEVVSALNESLSRAYAQFLEDVKSK